jgi:hypothetical protein
MQLTEWPQMVIAEPELAALERHVEAYARLTHITTEWELELVWAHGFKPRLEALVGWKCLLACLQSSTAYHVAYDRLYGLLMVRVEATR